jgi:hypothetical protein
MIIGWSDEALIEAAGKGRRRPMPPDLQLGDADPIEEDGAKCVGHVFW